MENISISMMIALVFQSDW